MTNLLISWSGGETSAYMARRLLMTDANLYDQVIVAYANTGEENEETLEFITRCDVEFGFNTVWLEAIVSPVNGEGTRAKVVDFKSASRNGEPFEAVIAKYGIPNVQNPHCSRELKRKVILAYARSLSWTEYDTAIGIRADEFDRMSTDAIKDRIIYPLVNWEIDKPFINRYWRDQPFRLQLKGYEGNCKWCWKKSLRKLGTIAQQTPEAFEFPARMEEKYEQFIPPSRLIDPNSLGSKFRETGEPIRFFRNNLAVADILTKAQDPSFVPATDDRLNTTSYNQISLFSTDSDILLDVSAGCSESCEAF